VRRIFIYLLQIPLYGQIKWVGVLIMVYGGKELRIFSEKFIHGGKKSVGGN
jgi:hypothetical protein